MICDGQRLGIRWNLCVQSERIFNTHSTVEARLTLRLDGWTRRHHMQHGDPTLVDLCPSCSNLVTLVPPVFKGGRPRKDA